MQNVAVLSMPASNPDDELSQAWKDAAADLEISVQAPYWIPADGSYRCIAWIEHFGRPNGTLAVRNHGGGWKVIQSEAASRGLFLSALSDSYRHYQRDRFIATLDDWGWFGPDNQRPAWYSGTPWTD
jgi:hypothetical protein